MSKRRLSAIRFVSVVTAVLMLLSFACTESEPEPTATRVVEPTATTAPAPPTATAVPPTATPEPIADVSADPLPIVATSNIVGEWVAIVGGDRVEVLNLVPRGVDPHGYQPGARDIARVADADLVFAVGLSLEQGWLEDLIDNAAADHDVVIELGQRIDPIEFSFEGEDDHGEEDDHAEEEGEDHDEDAEEEGEDHGDEDAEEEDHHGDEDEDEDAEEEDHHGDEDEDEDAEEEDHHGDEDEDADEEEGEEHHGDEDEDADDEEGEEHHGDEDEDEDHDEDEVEHHHEDDGHGHGALDPHFWFDPERVIVAVRQIAKELRELDPDSTDYYNSNRDEYIAQLEELDHWIEESVSAIDDHDRILVTTHDSFGYFATKFGFEVAGVIIPGGGTELERSPQELAELVHEVEEAGATVVFAEAQLSDRLANTLAREAGIKFVGGLYTGSLGEDGSGATTYVEMMRSNVGIIVGALAE